MPLVKRLYITASDSYSSNKQIVPINSRQKVSVESKIGKFDVAIYIKNFDGSKPHLSNSYYNKTSSQNLIHDNIRKQDENANNLQIEITFTPNKNIVGSQLIFGNDTMVSIKDVIPVHLLSTGLKFFTWFINKTIKADIYCDTPFLYGLAINSFSHINVGETINQDDINSENLQQNLLADDNGLNIPKNSLQRMKYFLDFNHCEKFVYHSQQPYFFQFDTNFVKMLDSKYAVAIPTYGNKTFDIDVSAYANENLNNFNWVIKLGGIDAVGDGDLGLIINFALLEEEENEQELEVD